MNIIKLNAASIRAGILVLISFFLMTCSNTPVTTWHEFHGNNGNTGFTNFPSRIIKYLKWQFTVGDVKYSSPVVDDEGTVYVGNMDGDLFAIKPDGTQKWKEHLGARLSSPALGASGNIYITNIQGIESTNPSSSLFSLDRDGHPLPNGVFAFPDHGFTTAPPKTWSNGTDEFIFVPVKTDKGEELFTFTNDHGAKFMTRNAPNCIPDEIINKGIENPFEFNVSGINIRGENDMPPVAITTAGDGGDKNPIIVYAPKNCHLMGYRLHPDQKKMEEIWYAPGTYSFFPPPATPAITSGGLIQVGHGKTISAYNLMTGKITWEYVDNNPLNQDFYGFYDAPAILAGTSPSYNTFNNRIIIIDDKGNKQGSSFGLASRTEIGTSPLVTTKYVYAAFPSGLYTLDLKLNQVGHIDFIPGPKTSVHSSPAIGPDGTIYMVDPNGILEAFGGTAMRKAIEENK